MKNMFSGAVLNSVSMIKSFGRDEKGAVTVDWVVLAAFLVVLGLGISSSMKTSIDGTTDQMVQVMSDQADEIASYDTFSGN